MKAESATSEMTDFFAELFDQNYYFNEKVIAELMQNQNITLGRCHDLISHMLNAHVIWNSRINKAPIDINPWSPRELDELSQLNKSCFDASILILRDSSLNSQVEYTTQSGKVFKHKIRELLFQVINHSTYHRAQIAMEFRQSGITPLLTDYIVYKMIVPNSPSEG
ncbi:MAG: DinB family protein [Cyclobacteriaceae bacterium]